MRSLVLACALATTSAWRFPGLARPREEDVIEHEVTPTGPRELTIETHDYEAHESTMVLPFEDTHTCLLQSLKDYLDTHAEDQFESKIMLKIGRRLCGNQLVRVLRGPSRTPGTDAVTAATSRR